MVGGLRVEVIGTRGFPGVGGGVERHCESLYPRMAALGADVTVYRRRPWVSPCAGRGGVRFRDLPSTRARGLEAALHSLLATCSALARRPDVVCYHNIGPALFSPLLGLRGIPFVLTYHSANYEHAKWGPAARALLRLGERVAFARAAAVVFVSGDQMRRCAGRVAGEAVAIPNGVEPPAAPSGEGLLRRLGLGPRRYVLAVGRVVPEKGLDVLVRAFRRAAPAGTSLLVAGDRGQEPRHARELEALAAGAPVVFAGELRGDELAQAYANAALFVLPSRSEGFPLALLEAMSYGLDVAASDIPGARLAGLGPGDLFPVGDDAALAALVARKLGEGRRREWDLSGFDWDEIAGETLAVCGRAAGRGGRAS